MFNVKADINIDVKKRMKVVQSDKLWKFAANEWWRLMDDYVPMDSGTLAHNVDIEPNTVTYKSPYAHYLYEGKAMSPAYPIMQNGVLVGFFTPKGTRKEYNGKKLKYNTDRHANAGADWSERAKKKQLPKLAEALEKYLAKEFD